MDEMMDDWMGETWKVERKTGLGFTIDKSGELPGSSLTRFHHR